VSATACIRCGEGLVDPAKACGFCTAEIRHNAVLALVESSGRSDRDKLSRANAVDALRMLGHSQEEALHARARAFDGHSVEEILEGLCGDERVGVAA
jgi:hypothetical protein